MTNSVAAKCQYLVIRSNAHPTFTRHTCEQPATHRTTWSTSNMFVCARHAIAVNRNCVRHGEPKTCERLP